MGQVPTKILRRPWEVDPRLIELKLHRRGLLEYERWENFISAIGRAKIACEGSGQSIQDHFRDVTKMIELGKGAVREIVFF